MSSRRAASIGRWFLEWIKSIAVALVVWQVVRTLVIEAFRIPSGSMENTLLVGDFLFVNKFLYGPEIPFTDWRVPGLRDPQRGDIIVFRYPQDEKRDFIKRIVAGPSGLESSRTYGSSSGRPSTITSSPRSIIACRRAADSSIRSFGMPLATALVMPPIASTSSISFQASSASWLVRLST